MGGRGRGGDDAAPAAAAPLHGNPYAIGGQALPPGTSIIRGRQPGAAQPQFPSPCASSVTLENSQSPTRVGDRNCDRLGCLSSYPPQSAQGQRQAENGGGVTHPVKQFFEQAANIIHPKPEPPAGGEILTKADVQGLLDDLYVRVKEDVLGEIKQEMKNLSVNIQQHNRKLDAQINRVAEQMGHLSAQVSTLQAQTLSGNRFGVLVGSICGGGRATPTQLAPSMDMVHRTSTARSHMPAVDDDLDSLDIPTAKNTRFDVDRRPTGQAEKKRSAKRTSVGAKEQGMGRSPTGGENADLGKTSLLGTSIKNFEKALAESGGSKEPSEVLRAPLFAAFDGVVEVLDAVSDGQMGSYLASNVKKLKESKANAKETGYRGWLLSELPQHGPSYSGYADPSAWMGNLWIGWTLDFFVELFDQLHEGKDTRQAADAAYNKTLYHHHNFGQRMLFQGAVKKLPARDELFLKLSGKSGAKADDVVRDLGAFVKSGRIVVRFCDTCNEEMDALLKKTKAGK